MGTFHRNIKHLAGENIGGSDTAADHGSSGSVDTGIRALGPAKAEFHNAVSLCCIYHTGGLGSDQTLMIQHIENSRLHKLSLHYRGYDLQQRFSGEHNSPFRNGVDITCKMKSS